MINIETLQKNVNSFILNTVVQDPYDPTIGHDLSNNDGKLHLELSRNYLLHYFPFKHDKNINGIVLPNKYMIADSIHSSSNSTMIDLYSKIRNHSLYQYCYNNNLSRTCLVDHNNRILSYSIAMDADCESNLLCYSRYKDILYDYERIDLYRIVSLMRIIDVDNILKIDSFLSKVSKDAYRSRHKANRFLAKISDNIDNKVAIYLLDNLIDMIEQYMKLKVQYMQLQLNLVIDDFKNCIKASDDGTSGVIKNIGMYVTVGSNYNSTNRNDSSIDAYRPTVAGFCIRNLVLDSAFRELTNKKYHVDVLDDIGDSTCHICNGNDCQYDNSDDSISRVMDTITKECNAMRRFVHNYRKYRGVNSYNYYKNPIALLVKCLTYRKMMIGVNGFAVDMINPIEVIYDDGHTEYLIINKVDCIQNYKNYVDKEKCCVVLSSYSRYQSKDAIDSNALRCISTQSNLLTMPYVNNAHLITNGTFRYVGSIQDINIDDIEVTKEEYNYYKGIFHNFSNMTDIIYKELYKYNIIRERKQISEMITTAVMKTFVAKSFFKNDPERIQSYNIDLSNVVNSTAKKIPLFKDMIEKFERYYDCHLEWVLQVDPKYLKHLYINDDTGIYSTLIDPSENTYRNIIEANGNGYYGSISTDLSHPFIDATREIRCNPAFVRLYNNQDMLVKNKRGDVKFYNKKIKKILHCDYDKQHSRDTFIMKMFTMITSKTNYEFTFNHKCPMKNLTTGSILLAYGDSSSCDFNIPVLIYTKLTDRKSGAPLNINKFTYAYDILLSCNIPIYIRGIYGRKYGQPFYDLNKKYIDGDVIDVFIDLIVRTIKGYKRYFDDLSSSLLRDQPVCFGNTFEDTIAEIVYYDDTNTIFDTKNPYWRIS